MLEFQVPRWLFIWLLVVSVSLSLCHGVSDMPDSPADENDTLDGVLESENDWPPAFDSLGDPEGPIPEGWEPTIDPSADGVPVDAGVDDW
jgi:hypothetical protein